jgi:endoribonuclease YbeY-like protein
MAELTLDLRAERDGADVALADGLCGLSEAAAQALAAETLRRVGVSDPVAIDVLVTDDGALRMLNRDYRGRDEFTDVLSFPLLEAPLIAAPAEQLWGAADQDEDDARPLTAHAARDAALGAFVAHVGDADATQGDAKMRSHSSRRRSCHDTWGISSSRVAPWRGRPPPPATATRGSWRICWRTASCIWWVMMTTPRTATRRWWRISRRHLPPSG